MEWSRYNILFETKNNEWLLYNSASNSFLKMDKEAAQKIKKVKENPNIDFTENPDIYFKLRVGGFLVEDGQDDAFLRILKMKRLTANYASRRMLLTIAPTIACNFACKYCFENNKMPVSMSDETEKKIIEFIAKFNTVEEISLTWFGV